MQDDPCTLHWQDEMAIRRMLSQPRRTFRCLAVRQSRACKTAATSAARPGETRCTPGCIEGGCSSCFTVECASSRDASAIPALLVAVVRARLSWSATEAVFRCWERAAKSAAPETPNVRFATQDLQPSTGEEAACSRQRRKLERIASAMAVYGIRLRKIVRADGRQVEGRGYALWRADSSAICGRVAGVC